MRSGPQSRVIRKILSTSIRLLVTAGLMAILAARFDLGRSADLMVHASLPLMAAVLGALLAADSIAALRWHLILGNDKSRSMWGKTPVGNRI